MTEALGLSKQARKTGWGALGKSDAGAARHKKDSVALCNLENIFSC
jgi:hypothetical protein